MTTTGRPFVISGAWKPVLKSHHHNVPGSGGYRSAIGRCYPNLSRSIGPCGVHRTISSSFRDRPRKSSTPPEPRRARRAQRPRHRRLHTPTTSTFPQRTSWYYFTRSPLRPRIPPARSRGASPASPRCAGAPRPGSPAPPASRSRGVGGDRRGPARELRRQPTRPEWARYWPGSTALRLPGRARHPENHRKLVDSRPSDPPALRVASAVASSSRAPALLADAPSAPPSPSRREQLQGGGDAADQGRRSGGGNRTTATADCIQCAATLWGQQLSSHRPSPARSAGWRCRAGPSALSRLSRTRCCTTRAALRRSPSCPRRAWTTHFGRDPDLVGRTVRACPTTRSRSCWRATPRRRSSSARAPGRGRWPSRRSRSMSYRPRTSSARASSTCRTRLRTIVPSFAVNMQPISDASTVVRPQPRPRPHPGPDQRQAPPPLVHHRLARRQRRRLRIAGARHLRHPVDRATAGRGAARRGGGTVRLGRHRRGHELPAQGRPLGRRRRAQHRHLRGRRRRGVQRRRQRRAAVGGHRLRQPQPPSTAARTPPTAAPRAATPSRCSRRATPTSPPTRPKYGARRGSRTT